MRFPIKNEMLTISANNSANSTETQIPSNFQISGNAKIMRIWKTKVLKKEIIAETTPSFSAVKNDELKMLIPLIK